LADISQPRCSLGNKTARPAPTGCLLSPAAPCSAAPVSGLSDLEGMLFAFKIRREEIGFQAALPRVASHAPALLTKKTV
jgi:hypothetical protein